MLTGVRALATALDNGATWTSWIHKTGGPTAGTAGRWCDASMGAGIPKYNAYVGSQLTATALANDGNAGIYLGPDPGAGLTRHINALQLQSTSTTLAPAWFVLADYVLFYPLVDGDSTDQQDMSNSATLPRYADGAGVQCMVVVTTPMAANAVATVSYTNQAGVAGRTSTFQVIASTNVGVIASSSDSSGAAGSVGPFIPLASGDTGIRSIESITLASGAGGFFALVLVRPLAHLQLRENVTATEIMQLPQRATLPRVFDGAYLNFIYITNQTGTPTTLRGFVEFAWGS